MVFCNRQQSTSTHKSCHRQRQLTTPISECPICPKSVCDKRCVRNLDRGQLLRYLYRLVFYHRGHENSFTIRIGIKGMYAHFTDNVGRTQNGLARNLLRNTSIKNRRDLQRTQPRRMVCERSTAKAIHSASTSFRVTPFADPDSPWRVIDATAHIM